MESTLLNGGCTKSLLSETGAYQKHPEGDFHYFGKPNDGKLDNLWGNETDSFLKSHDKCTLKQIYEF